jgi:hypothetical protein
MAELVRRARERALDQYLLLLAWAGDGERDVHRPSAEWARALGFPDDEASGQRVSRNWRILRELRLVRTEKRGRNVSATPLREDGSGAAYEPPRDDFLILPDAYWRERWHVRLDLAAKAMLLIALSLPDRFPLSPRHATSEYGISKSTAERGLRALRRHGLLRTEQQALRTPRAPKGYTVANVYTLQPPFDQATREPAARRARQARSTTPSARSASSSSNRPWGSSSASPSRSRRRLRR